MNEEMENKLVPDLRFPEYENDKDWESLVLEDVCSITNGKANVQDHIENGKYPLFDRSATIKKSNEYIFDSEAVIIPGEGMYFIPKYYFGKFNLHQRAYALKDFTIVGLFAYYQLEFNNKLLSEKAVKSTVLSLRLPILQKFPINIPNRKEQQKIADCLSSLDDLIGAETEKLAGLKEHKKGLMQQLFPAEGEKVPKLRFPEFKDSGDWDERRMEYLATKISDGIHSTPVYSNNDKYYFINGNNLISGKIYIDKKTKTVSEHEYLKHKRDLTTSTILISINGTIGNIAVFNDERVILGKSACYVNIDETKSIRDFIIYSIQTDVIKGYFNSELTGSTIKNLSLKSIKETILFIPSIDEQKKIASFLNLINDQIEKQSQKIEDLKLHKKGLMQGLFPNIN